ncbi:MAG: replicative DNA helicase [Lautropia sp.]|nr:replicative DNA helicase [Lautropia sp.]
MDKEVSQLRLPPHSVEAEQSVLGGLLLNNRVWDDVADLLSEDDFYRLDHRLIWQHMVDLLRRERPADALTVIDALKQSGRLEDAGGPAYLASLSNTVASAANITHYAEMVRDRAVLRRLIGVADEIASDAFDAQGKPVNEVLDAAEAKVFKIAENSGKKQQDFQDLGTLTNKVFMRIEELYGRENPSEITGVPTGFIDLDRMTSGMQPGDLIIVAARPSVGKTAFALNIGENVALNGNKAVAVFSMEMGAEQLTMRLLGSIGRLDQQRLRNGQLNEDDFERLTSAMAKMDKAPLFIDETPALNPFELRARARRLDRRFKDEGGLGLIIVDYLQLMSAPNGGGTENRATQVGEISRALKSLAKELKCPLIALSQLSREVEKRQDKKPIMSDLRESGSIEQDADVIFFIHRDDRYDPDADTKGMAEIIIGKQRNGPIGSVTLAFHGQYTKFDNYAGPQGAY